MGRSDVPAGMFRRGDNGRHNLFQSLSRAYLCETMPRFVADADSSKCERSSHLDVLDRDFTNGLTSFSSRSLQVEKLSPIRVNHLLAIKIEIEKVPLHYRPFPGRHESYRTEVSGRSFGAEAHSVTTSYSPAPQMRAAVQSGCLAPAFRTFSRAIFERKSCHLAFVERVSPKPPMAVVLTTGSVPDRFPL